MVISTEEHQGLLRAIASANMDLAKANARIAELAAQLAAVQAELAEDIACPYCELLAWTRITDDPATWPTRKTQWVVVVMRGGFTYAAWSHVIGKHEIGQYWFPITPPEAEA